MSWLKAGMAYPARTRLGPTDSKIPMLTPPSIAPTMLPMPPSTAEVKALIPGRNPEKKLRLGNTSPHNPPATPAMAPPTANTLTIVPLTSIPISAAVSGSSATARIDFPVLVRSTNK